MFKRKEKPFSKERMINFVEQCYSIADTLKTGGASEDYIAGFMEVVDMIEAAIESTEQVTPSIWNGFGFGWVGFWWRVSGPVYKVINKLKGGTKTR